jgi:hypothetical protein
MLVQPPPQRHSDGAIELGFLPASAAEMLVRQSMILAITDCEPGGDFVFSIGLCPDPRG